ncbi:hypothetical protein [Xanthomonas campestris]|uniref:hypothetical protein n=1 Tax=Xanthomonas campestris TaxID=339 RepID=UPI000E1EAD63|nr:hypothetical protein [Xanthomonas campestris]
MRERPILFNGAMVRAILAGQKTQTRQALKMPHGYWETSADGLVPIPAGCPFVQPGDRLWVRETTHVDRTTSDSAELARYSADQKPVCYPTGTGNGYDGAWQLWWYTRDTCPNIHMPRSACRLLLEITDVRVERLQAISEADAQAEGARHFPQLPMGMVSADPCRWSMEEPQNTDACLSTARFAFANYFCKTYGKAPKGLHDQRPWDANPWVWVITFQRLP